MKLNELHDDTPAATVKSPIQQTLEDARQFIWQHRDRGTVCPCCGQTCRVYRRSISGNMARWLIELVKLWRASGGQWVDITRKPMSDYHRSGDYAKLVYWGLIEARPSTNATKARSGLWKPTRYGALWVDGEAAVAQYCHVYLNKPIDFSGPDVTIQQSLGTKFDYNEIIQP